MVTYIINVFVGIKGLMYEVERREDGDSIKMNFNL